MVPAARVDRLPKAVWNACGIPEFNGKESQPRRNELDRKMWQEARYLYVNQGYLMTAHQDHGRQGTSYKRENIKTGPRSSAILFQTFRLIGACSATALQMRCSKHNHLYVSISLSVSRDSHMPGVKLHGHRKILLLQNVESPAGRSERVTCLVFRIPKSKRYETLNLQIQK